MGWGIARGFQETVEQLVSWDGDAAQENRTEAVDRVQIKPKSQRAPASCIPSNQEPGIGDPTPAVTSQGSGGDQQKGGPPPWPWTLGSPEGGEQREAEPRARVA